MLTSTVLPLCAVFPVLVSLHTGLSPLHNAVIGFMTGAITAAATEPVDVIRTRIMGQVRRSKRG